MFQLFQSIFGPSPPEQGRYPRQLVEAAIERALDATDPRLRFLSGYQKKLRPAVIHAIDQVMSLVDGLPPPVEVSRAVFWADSRLPAIFVSADHLQQVVSADRALADFLARPGGLAAERVVALLLMQKEERNVLGTEIQGEMVMREVPQVTVSFTGHRLLDPTAAEEETRRLLKRRAFDHLLALALGRIASAHAERVELEQQRTLLRHKLATLESGRWSFEPAGAGDTTNVAAIEAQLGEIAGQLRELGADAGTLRLHLDILIEVLGRAQEQLWSKRISLIVDRMGIKRKRATSTAAEIVLDELHSASGRTAIMLPVSIPPGELRPRSDIFAEAQRYLGL